MSEVSYENEGFDEHKGNFYDYSSCYKLGYNDTRSIKIWPEVYLGWPKTAPKELKRFCQF